MATSCSRRSRCLFAALIAGLIAACKPAPPPTVDDLTFPVLVLFESGGLVRHDDAKDLQVMSTQRVINSNSAPFLIDSKLDIYRLDKLASTHGVWLMANPVGTTEVTFELARVAQGDVEQARRLIAERDWQVREGSDDTPRQRLAQAGDLRAMLEAIGK